MAIEAARLFVKVGSDTREGEAGLNSFNDRLNAAARNLTMTGGLMTAGLTLPLLAVGKSAISMAGDYEQTMNILQQVTGASADTMASLNAQALQLGADTVFSAGEAANAMLELGKAGMDTEQIMAAIPGVMDLAAAGGVALTTAAGLTAATLNAFHLEASESARVANLLAAAANASAADISDLGQGMQQAGFAFSMANQPVENLAASLAILTNVGLTGSDAGTALKNAFMRMMNPTVEATGVMNELGISFYDAQGAMLPLPAIIDMLNSATAGLTDQQRDQALATIFLSDGMKAMIPLMEAGSEGFNEMVGDVTQAGAASDVANARMMGLKGGLEQLRGSVESFLIGAAQPFLGILGGLARQAAEAINWFGALPQPVINATIAFLGIVAAAGPVITGLGLVAGALGFLIGPIGLVVAATATLAAAWAADFGGIQGITATAMAAVQGWFASTLTSAQNLMAGISAAFANTSFPSLETLWQQFQAGDFQTVANTIRNTAYSLLVNLDAELGFTVRANELKARLVDVVGAVDAAVSGIDYSALTGLVGIAKGFDPGQVIADIKTSASSIRDNLLSGLTSAIDGTDWAQGGSIFSGLINSLSSAINNLDFSPIDWVGLLTTKLLGPYGAALGAIQWVIGSAEFEGLKGSVIGAIGTIDWSMLGTSFLSLGGAISNQLGAILADVSGEISSRLPDVNIDWDKFIPRFDLSQTNLDNMRDGILSGISTAIEGVDWGQGGSTFAGMINSLTASINTLDFSGIDWAGVFTRVLLGPAGAALGAIQWVIGSGEFEGLKTSVKGAIGGIDWGELGTSFTGLGTAIGTQIGAIFTDMSADISALIPDFTMPTLPEIDIDWEQLTIDTVGLITSVTTSINNIDWVSVGENVGSALVGAVTTGIGAIGAAIAAVNWTADAIESFKLRALGLAANIGFEIGTALGQINLGEAFVNLEGSIRAALLKVMLGIGSQIGSELNFMLDLPPVNWEALIEPLEWITFIPANLTWDGFVESLTWENFLTVMDWASFIASVNWSNFIFNLAWSSFVPDISWSSFIPDMGWGDFIPSLDWSRFIPFLGGLLGGASSNATGDSYFEGGMTWVGERGPELVRLPRGSRIFNNQESMAIAGGGPAVIIQEVHIHNDMDAEALANRIARIQRKRLR